MTPQTARIALKKAFPMQDSEIESFKADYMKKFEELLNEDFNPKDNEGPTDFGKFVIEKLKFDPKKPFWEQFNQLGEKELSAQMAELRKQNPSLASRHTTSQSK